jgi:hypothetical protein
MKRSEINALQKKCVNLVINKNCFVYIHLPSARRTGNPLATLAEGHISHYKGNEKEKESSLLIHV